MCWRKSTGTVSLANLTGLEKLFVLWNGELNIFLADERPSISVTVVVLRCTFLDMLPIHTWIET